MASQLNTIPNYPVQLVQNQQTSKDWYFFWSGLFRGLPPANVEEVALTGSPFIYTAPRKGSLIVSGGTVSAIEFSRDGVTFYDTGQTSGMIPSNAADQIQITYAVAPTVTFVPS